MISTTISEGKYSDVVDKINAETANTGISASLDNATGRITLTENQSREIKITNIEIENIYCTKIASKLSRTFTDKHGYKDLCAELLNKNISKNEQTSDWGNINLTLAQQKYAATDVLYLHKLRDRLDKILIREKRMNLAKACFNFIKFRTDLDLEGWAEQDIFKH